MNDMKPGTKIGLLAAVLAASTAWYWFHLCPQVALPEDRTGFVVAFLACVCLGVLALVNERVG